MRPFLTAWVGSEIALRSAPVGQIILMGAWVNSLAFIPFSQLQSQSRPDVVAKFHLIELIPFVGILWLGLRVFGLVGGAAAWTLRVAVDAVLLFWAAGFRWKAVRSFWIGVLLIGASGLVAWISQVSTIVGLILGLILVVVATCWAAIIEPRVRKHVSAILSSLIRHLPGK
jgi:O-antigen/teichoic acid export membrane protein